MSSNDNAGLNQAGPVRLFGNGDFSGAPDFEVTETVITCRQPLAVTTVQFEDGTQLTPGDQVTDVFKAVAQGSFAQEDGLYPVEFAEVARMRQSDSTEWTTNFTANDNVVSSVLADRNLRTILVNVNNSVDAPTNKGGVAVFYRTEAGIEFSEFIQSQTSADANAEEAVATYISPDGEFFVLSKEDNAATTPSLELYRRTPGVTGLPTYTFQQTLPGDVNVNFNAVLIEGGYGYIAFEDNTFRYYRRGSLDDDFPVTPVETNATAEVDTEANTTAPAAVDVSFDGTVMVYGSQNMDEQVDNGGSAFIWTRSETTGLYGTPQQIDGDEVSLRLGSAVAVSPDGEWVAIGAIGVGTTDSKVLIYRRQFREGDFALVTEIFRVSLEQFGRDVAWSANGRMLFVGARATRGDVSIYRRQDNEFRLVQDQLTLDNSETANNSLFGGSLYANVNGTAFLTGITSDTVGFRGVYYFEATNARRVSGELLDGDGSLLSSVALDKNIANNGSTTFTVAFDSPAGTPVGVATFSLSIVGAIAANAVALDTSCYLRYNGSAYSTNLISGEDLNAAADITVAVVAGGLQITVDTNGKGNGATLPVRCELTRINSRRTAGTSIRLTLA